MGYNPRSPKKNPLGGYIPGPVSPVSPVSASLTATFGRGYIPGVPVSHRLQAVSPETAETGETGFPEVGEQWSHFFSPALHRGALNDPEGGPSCDPISVYHLVKSGPAPQPTSFDSYVWGLRNALRALCRRPGYPVGMLAWLQGSYPWLYIELTERIPREIHELATSRAPLETFDELLCRWLDYHEEGCQLYAVWQRSIRPHWRKSMKKVGNGSSSKPNSQAQLDS